MRVFQEPGGEVGEALLALGVERRVTVVEHHQVRGLFRVVLSGHVNPVSMLSPGIRLARKRVRTPDLSLGNADPLAELIELVEQVFIDAPGRCSL